MSEKIVITMDTEVSISSVLPRLTVKAINVATREVETPAVRSICSYDQGSDNPIYLKAKVTGFYYPATATEKEAMDIYDIVFSVDGNTYKLSTEHVSFEDLEELENFLRQEAADRNKE